MGKNMPKKQVIIPEEKRERDILYRKMWDDLIDDKITWMEWETFNKDYNVARVARQEK